MMYTIYLLFRSLYDSCDLSLSLSRARTLSKVSFLFVCRWSCLAQTFATTKCNAT